MTMLRTLFALAAVSTTASAFQPFLQNQAKPVVVTPPSDKPHAQPTSKNPLASLALAGSIFTASLVGGLCLPTPAAAEVELSTGAIIINSSTKDGQSILKAEVEVKDLLGSLIKNRKALKESLGRITTVVKEELGSEVWRDLGKEVLQLEGDVAPSIRVNPPRDIQETIKDISRGKLNLIVNGEIINLSIDKTSSTAEDEIVLRAKGVKGVGPITFTEPAVTKVRTRLEDQMDAVREFWYAPIAFPEAIQDKLPEGASIDTGAVIVGGSVFTVVGAYGGSYAFYTYEQEQEEKKAAEKREQMAAKRKAAAAKKAAAEAAKKAEESQE